MSRRFTFPILLVPAIMIVIFTSTSSKPCRARPRAFALYFVLQAVIAVTIAHRRGDMVQLVEIVLVGMAMATVTVFGLSI